MSAIYTEFLQCHTLFHVCVSQISLLSLSVLGRVDIG